MNKKGIIYGINGPVIYLKGNTGLRMSEMVHVGEEHLVGEVISLSKKATTVQVFEETTGLKPGAEVVGTGDAISVTLGPGILNNIFDGIERPLSEIAARSGKYITRGVSVDSLDTSKKWNVHVTVSEGDHVTGGTVIAETQETASILHRSMVPPDVEGTVIKAAPDGAYTIVDPIVTLELADGTAKELSLCQKWPIRVPRPTKRRFPASRPLITGQRILDTMFPIAKGGTAAVPGGFGTGKTMTQHQIAKWSDADIIIYIGCGERGNEMTQVLEEFGELVDPKTGHPLMNRTALIANTSNMPVAAREASIYTGLTLAEYYRDMGYDVAIMADSTSRWAEALRELSGRLEEMPAEEGFPAYLASRLSAFYERAGMMENLNGTEGSVSIIGALSPQGGDFSEPVTMNTKRFVRCFWGLDKSLAYARHFPAIHWLTSYSEYLNDLAPWYQTHVNKNFIDLRNQIMALLNTESSLMEIVKQNLENMSQIQRHTENMLAAGTAEPTDVDQIRITVGQLKNSLLAMQRTVDVNYNLLRLQLGLQAGTPITLADQLDNFLEVGNFLKLAGQEFDINQNAQYKLMETQEELQKKMVGLKKWAYSPTISANYGYTYKILKPSLDFSPKHSATITMSIPIFSGLQRKAQLDQEKITLEQTTLNKSLLADQLNLQEEQYKFALKNALEDYNLQSENIQVARKVLENYQYKYNAGAVSSLDLTQANNNYLTAENNYTSACLTLLQAQTQLEKL